MSIKVSRSSIDSSTVLPLKSIDEFDDAVKARLQKEAELCGEFAPQRFLFSEYGVEEPTENVTIENNDTMLSDELNKLKPGEKATVKVATIDDKGVMVLISGDKRINAKMIGIEFSNELPDTLYLVDQDLSGKNVEIAFDETKTSNGYAMVYIYTDKDTLYNAKLLKEGKLTFDSTTSKKALEYLESETDAKGRKLEIHKLYCPKPILITLFFIKLVFVVLLVSCYILLLFSPYNGNGISSYSQSSTSTSKAPEPSSPASFSMMISSVNSITPP